MYRDLPYLPAPERGAVTSLVRGLAALALRRASALLARVALGVAGAAAQAPAEREPVLEFYAEAGAPEGALYVDGVLVGTVVGVGRL